MNETLPAPRKPAVYGRLGTSAIVNQQAHFARKAGAVVARNQSAGTVEAVTTAGELVFKALRKGPPGAPWLVIYSTQFYPKNV